MRIAMVGPFGFEPKKTMRSRAFRLARELVLRGHQVAIIMPPWHTPKQANHVWTEDGVTLIYTAVHGGPLAITARLIRAVKSWQPDIVHCFKPKAYSGFVAEWLWRTQRRRVRIVMDTDDWEGWGGWNDLENYPALFKHLFALQEQWGMQHCHALTVASRALETLALGNGIVQAKLHYVPNGPGIATESVSAQADSTRKRPTILLYSRLFEFDVGRLVAVLKQVHAAMPSVRLLMVGASLHAADGQRFARLMQAAGLADMVEDVGWLEEAALPAVLSSAEVGIYLMDDTLLNRTKCPVKLADMAALGLPVVGEAVGQVSEYIRHEHTGLLCTSGDTDALATSLINVLKDANKRRCFGTAARQHMQQFAWSQAAVALEEAYRP